MRARLGALSGQPLGGIAGRASSARPASSPLPHHHRGAKCAHCRARRRQRAKACAASCAIVSFLSAISWIASAWVWLFTSSMPPELRDRQRAERAAHVCDHIEHSTAAGQTPLRMASDLVRALVVGMPADIVFAISSSARFVNADPNKKMDVNWKLLIGLLWTVVIISVVVVMIQGPEHARQNSHLIAVRWVRGIGGIVLFASAAWALVRQRLSRTRTGSVVFGAIASVLIGAYLVRLGLSPR